METLPAPAKANLTLHITGRRADGYHLIDSLVAFADIGDRVEVRERAGVTLTVDGPFADAIGSIEENLVLRAARLLWNNPLPPGEGRVRALYGEEIEPSPHPSPEGRGGFVRLTKHLPPGAGLGGGSSDAAAALHLLCRLWRLPHSTEELAALALPLGADMPVCLAGTAARVGGIGEKVTPVPGFPPVPVVLAYPGRGLSSGEVYRKYGRGAPSPPSSPTDGIPSFSTLQSLADWLRPRRNDLEEAAVALLPAVGDVLAALRKTSQCLLARMSGSGSACFGIFPDTQSAAAAASQLAAGHPSWWVRACTLR